ncbi:MAG: OsmC family protein [Bacteroidetes bacterium]|nr:MAG: OsmC family protein [Bacteroidota bacterium]
MEKLLDNDVKVFLGGEKYTTQIDTVNHVFLADEPENKGGFDKGPAPYQLLLASLGSCTAITVKMYAERKNWPLENVHVTLNMEQEDTPQGKHTVFIRKLHLAGALSQEQQERLLTVAKACPVAKILTGTIEIDSRLV